MSPFEILRLAASALTANRARSALTVLSITIGAFAIVLMSSLAESGLNTLAHGIEELGGARILLVWSKQSERAPDKAFAYPRGMRPVDRERVMRDVPHIQEVTLYSQMDELDAMTERGNRDHPSVIASDGHFFSAFGMAVAEGSFFTDDDNRQRAAVCVIGKKVVDNAFPAPLDPVGEA